MATISKELLKLTKRAISKFPEDTSLSSSIEECMKYPLLDNHICREILDYYCGDESNPSDVEDLELYTLLSKKLDSISVSAFIEANDVMEGLLQSMTGGYRKYRSMAALVEKAEENRVLLKYGNTEIDCALILYTLAESVVAPEVNELTFVASWLNNNGITTKILTEMSKFGKRIESNATSTPGMDPAFHGGAQEVSSKSGQSNSGSEPTDLPNLRQYSRCLTDLAKSGSFDPVFGRDKEIEKLIEILCCRKKNNAVLIGDAGVGKTATIEALAQRITEETVPEYLKGKQIFSLDLNSLLAGCIYRGQYEERLQNIIEEVTKREQKDLIIFIDELHTLIGNGSSSGTGDAANILKPYLARGEFQCIGATTIDEYRKHIEKDAALKRRFQEIIISEPSDTETADILRLIQTRYEEYHGVSYTAEAIEECVKMAGRFITDRRFPDKAIDILDLAGSKIKLANPPIPNKNKKIEKAKSLIAKKQEEMKNAMMKYEFELAAEYRQEWRQAEEDLKVLAEEEKKARAKHLSITPDLIDKTISELTGIPAEKLGKDDIERLRSMKGVMESEIKGQPQAIREVLGSLQRNSLGFRDPKKPIASFLFVGPTGTGKTYLCKKLASEFFGTEDALIRIDCSTLSEKTGVSSLTGSTPGYVGYDDQTHLDKVRTKRYAVVLFDEIEKASEEVKQSLLSVLDDGYITKGNGMQIDFRNTIIIFTSNTGTKALQVHGNGLGFSQDSEETQRKTKEKIVENEIKKEFSPEFINRLTSIVQFHTLTESDLSEIIDLEVGRLEKRIQDSKLGSCLVIDESVKKAIVKKCNPEYGARDIQREIIENIEKPLTAKILDSGKPGEGVKLKFTYDEENNTTIVKFSRR
jgi:ATP-dependent Clp protease ATP-binding subunit ClpC